MFSGNSCSFLAGLPSTPAAAVGRLAGSAPLSDLHHNTGKLAISNNPTCHEEIRGSHAVLADSPRLPRSAIYIHYEKLSLNHNQQKLKYSLFITFKKLYMLNKKKYSSLEHEKNIEENILSKSIKNQNYYICEHFILEMFCHFSYISHENKTNQYYF